MSQIDPNTSFNFAIAKVLAIFLVVGGHFFDGIPLWMLVTLGLFVFAYSSAYFTTQKYRPGYSVKSFWVTKIRRLGIPFWVTHLFLLGFFLVIGREGVWTWQTAVHWIGQSGWLNWFALPNPSPFGSGLWFFTLLLLFYVAYPVIDRWSENPIRAKISLVGVLVAALILQHIVHVGHMLWVTAFAFWYGVYSARNPVGGGASLWLGASIALLAILLGMNVAGIKNINIPLLIGSAIALVHWLERASLSKKYLCWLEWFTPCILEVYLIHTYLFVKNDWPLPLRFVLSIVLIIASAHLLARLANRLNAKLQAYSRPSKPGLGLER